MELEVAEKGEKNKKMERANMEVNAKLDTIYDDQTVLREGLESEMRKRLEQRDREIMTLKEKAQTQEHRRGLELDHIRTQNKEELENIQEKVHAAMAKKKDTIADLGEEVRLRDLQIIKLKELMEKQRRDLLR